MPEKALGPRDLDLGSLTDEQFEELCHRLVLDQHPEAVATANPDSGADSLLGSDGDWDRAWQAKRYTGNIHWAKCKESLDRAVERYGISRMTFCFARNLTSGQLKKFESDLVGRHGGVRVDF